ncbi:50S ribosomal protein L5 [Peredibacter starrii]|uniref:Large ribosomal subunit protein uL5 n=1 Tax=Peredibacter starrii TaxID=28202 RepID=A0AAX4HQ01_9BACT|nr:50S ribosomal protein L5 [Peredibacter starrii]WPU65243.1 50S ribosomal protein L5 [Peredibacter starrii]
MARLKALYESEIKKKLNEKFKYGNVHQIPKLEKIIVNCVTRDAVSNGKMVDSIVADLAAITGQKPVVARAKKSIASFKLRQDQALGAFVTLRGEQMYEFLDRLINLSLPRVKDFRGLSPKGFDGKGNYTMGLKEQIIFPEIDYDKIDKIRGMGISFVTTATNNEEGREMLKLFGMPFREK